MSKNFSKQLSHIKMPKVEAPLYKRKLKNAVRSVYFNKGTVKKGSSLFDDLKHMSLKKLIPATVLAVFVFTLAGQSFLSWRNTAYAQELIMHAINSIQPLSPVEEAKTLSTIQILEAAKKEGAIKYLGEELVPGSSIFKKVKMQKFSFTDQDLANDIILNVADNGEIFFSVDAPDHQYLEEDFSVAIDENGKVTNLNELQEKLQDPSLKKPWLIELIKRVNQDNMGREMGYFPPQKKLSLVEKKCESQAKKVIGQIQPLLEEAHVIHYSREFSCGPKHSDFGIKISILPISGQNIRIIDAKEEIQSLIDRLSQFQTPSAQMKIEILKKALISEKLKAYKNKNNPFINADFSFPYIGAGNNEELFIWVNPQDATENGVRFAFQNVYPLDMDGDEGERIEIRIKDGSISNAKELEKKLNDSNLSDSLLLSVIRSQNQRWLDGIKKDDQLKAGKLTPKMVEQLEDILSNSEVPIVEKNLYVPPKKKEGFKWELDPNVLYSIWIYFPFSSFSPSEISSDDDSNKKLDAVIENLKKTVNPEDKAALEILKRALESKSLTYVGQEGWGKEKVQKIKFQDKNLSSDVLLLLKENGEVEFMIDALFSRSLGERFYIETDAEVNVTNSDELRDAVKDPNLKEQWVKSLVKMSNLNQIQPSEKLSEEPLEVVYQNLTPQQIEESKKHDEEFRVFQKKCDERSEKIMQQIYPILKEAEVIIQPAGGGCGETWEDFSFYLSLFSIAGQEDKNNANKAEIQKMIDKLRTFKTSSAQMKIKILEKALSSNNLRNYPNAPISMLSFPYVDAKGDPELTIRADFSNSKEDFLELYFSTQPGEGKWKDIKIKNGEISNLEALKKSLSDNKLKDPQLKFLVREQNLGWVDTLRQYSLGKSWSKLTPKMLDQLETLLKDADVLISDRAEGGENVLYSIELYHLSK